MGGAALSLFVFGIYLVLGGLGFLISPDMPLSLLGIPLTDEPWIRVVGMVMLVLGYYYIRAGRSDLSTFFPWTVHARLGVFVVLLLMYLLALGPWQLLIFGVIDLLGAIWTYLTSRSAS